MSVGKKLKLAEARLALHDATEKQLRAEHRVRLAEVELEKQELRTRAEAAEAKSIALNRENLHNLLALGDVMQERDELRARLEASEVELRRARVENNHNWQANDMAESAMRERDELRARAEAAEKERDELRATLRGCWSSLRMHQELDAWVSTFGHLGEPEQAWDFVENTILGLTETAQERDELRARAEAAEKDRNFFRAYADALENVCDYEQLKRARGGVCWRAR